MTTANVKQLQRALNAFTNKHLAHVTPLRVDGDKGHATNRRIRQCKFWLGYIADNVSRKAGRKFLARLENPSSAKLATRKAIKRGKRRRAKQRKDAKANGQQAAKTTGVGTFDGKPVANLIIAHLKWAREVGYKGERWQGSVTSGYRSPEYSRQLCRNMCGADSCAGRCAGTASNHVGSTPERCAVDVTDYARFERLMPHSPHRPLIFNALDARDPLHFSINGR